MYRLTLRGLCVSKRHRPSAGEKSPLLAILSDVVQGETPRTSGFSVSAAKHDRPVKRSDERMLTLVAHPQVPLRSLPFSPPPRWAAEVTRQFGATFPQLQRERPLRYLQCFIHPTFTTSNAAYATMKAWSGVGETVLLTIIANWVVHTLRGVSRNDLFALVSQLTSDAKLSEVLSATWGLHHFILTDASAELLRPGKTGSTSGMIGMLSAQQRQQQQWEMMPDAYCAECVRAIVGAVCIEEGFDAAATFVRESLVPHLLN